MSIIFDKGMFAELIQYEEGLEEVSELCMYWAMFSMIFIMGRKGKRLLLKNSSQ